MKILFIHQNMPGQFKHLAPLLAQQNEVVFLTKRTDVDIDKVRRISYPAPPDTPKQTHQYIRSTDAAVRYGQAVARQLLELRKSGFTPDLIIAHPGWGEALYCKDVFPNTPLINFCEFYYRGRGLDVGFDPEESINIDLICRTRTRAGPLLLSLESCDRGVAPTQWQKSVHPVPFHQKMEVIFDGINAEVASPNEKASYELPDGRKLTKKDKVVTYVARNLEPYRGYKTMIRAIPMIQQRQPDAEIIIVGGEEVSYGSGPPSKELKTWRAFMDKEVEYDTSRVHFVGRVPYAHLIDLFRISSAHIYLTYPFVLSWSCLEALSSGALVIGSRTAPVEEVISDGRNGLLVDFFSPGEIADRVDDALRNPGDFEEMRANARQTVLDRYTIQTCLPKWLNLLKNVV